VATGGSPIMEIDASVRALDVHVENPGHVIIELVTLSCAGECADVVGVAHGGFPPYTWHWDDGETSAARRVCPGATRAYTVSVTDRGISTQEFQQAPETRQATVTAEVLGCDSPKAEAGAPGLCLQNPSFEGTVTPTQFTAFDAPPWNSCYTGGFITYSAIADSTLWPAQGWAFPSPSDGATYLALGQQAVFNGRASQTLCSPVTAGGRVSFFVDLARASSNNPAMEAPQQSMQILGGGTECAEDEVLWTSPPLTTEWATYCVTVTPARAMTTLGFRSLGTGGGEMEGLVDHIVPVAHCQ
jgi:hypothetical protein